jgi:hypothetical protein
MQDFKNIFAETFGKIHIWRFLTQSSDILGNKIFITLVFEKNEKFPGENRRQSPKIVIIPSIIKGYLPLKLRSQ